MDTYTLKGEISSKKLVCAFENFDFESFEKQNLSVKFLRLPEEDYWSTPKQLHPPDIKLQCIGKKLEACKRTRKEGKRLFSEIGVLWLTDVFEKFVKEATQSFGITPFFHTHYQVTQARQA